MVKTLALILALSCASIARATNTMPLKVDSANAAPCTVFGSPTPGMSCGKTSAPTQALDIAGNFALSGDFLASGRITPTVTRFGAGPAGVTVSSTVPNVTTYVTLLSSGGPITLTSTPSISTMDVNGIGLTMPEFLVLSSTSTNGITLQDEGTLTGSKLQLGSTTRVISTYKTLFLIFDPLDGFWREIAFGNN